MQIETMSMPVISTGHLNEADSCGLNADAYKGAMFTGVYGWIMFVPDDADTIEALPAYEW